MIKNKIISSVFILVLFYFPIHATYLFINTHLNLEFREKFDWENLYPFSNNHQKEINKNINIFETINKKIKSKINYVEKSFNSYIPYRYKICEIQMVISKYLGIKLFLDYEGLVVLNNGYLDTYSKDCSPSYAIEKTLNLFNYIKSLKTDFVFIIYPCKNSKYDNQLPKGLKDNANIACDKFLSALIENNVKTLDLRENANKQYKSQYEMFFKTDHHWKPSSGLWAAREICKYLNVEFNWNINTNLLDIDKFKITTKPNFFLGSLGKKISLTYIKPDDFDIIEPCYETNFQRLCLTWENATGSFNKVMFYNKHIENCNYYESNPYYYYLRRDEPYLRLINNSDFAYNKKVLLIRDSFNSVVSPFLALGIKDLTMVDTRYFSGSLRTIIEKEKYDLIMVAYNASIISDKSKLLDFD